MIYLLLCVLLNVLLVVFFKLFPKFGIENFQAIVFNYITCVITGSIFSGGFPVNGSSATQPWFVFAVIMGVGFIAVFNLLSYTTVKDGMATSTIANKLSLVIPVIVSIVLYHETSGWLKIAGIVLAFPAVYFTSRKKGEQQKVKSLVLPVLLFIFSGLLDTLVKYVERTHLPTTALQASFTVHVFSVAATIGIIVLVVRMASGHSVFALKNVVAGICLGIPNYFSIYYFIRLLNSGFMQSSAAIPVNNMAILLVSALVALIFFKEKLDRVRLLGLLLSLLSILLISFSETDGV